MIPFNKPHLTGKEAHYMYQAVMSGKISGNGIFTKKAQDFFETGYDFKKSLLTTSCTDALEMAALLSRIEPSDEVIVPSYTFVSTAIAFVREGAKIVFADSYSDNPNIDVSKIEELITEKTKIIVPVHYAGIACDMDAIMLIAEKYGLIVVEDAAQAIDSFYINKNPKSKRLKEMMNLEGKFALGSIGDMGCFSFHETKNIISGEGGMLAINNDKYINRAEIIWEKGTNRAEFFRGEVNKYGWVDIGSSFLPSETIAAFLWAQIENIEDIQNKRISLWNQYKKNLLHLEKSGFIKLPNIPSYATNNAHMFYILCPSLDNRSKLIEQLKKNDINAVFHYLSLHKSTYYENKHDGRDLVNSDMLTDRLLRLPLYYDLTNDEVDKICEVINRFYQ